VRFDPATGAVDRSSPIAGGQGGVDRLAATGETLWASAGPRRILYRLDAQTLDVRERLTMPGPTGPLAAVPAGLWTAAGRSIVLLDPETGEVVTSVMFRGRVKLLVADPTGQRLHVSTTAPIRHDATPILELDATTGEILARAWRCCADLNGPSGLSATIVGVWVTAPTGMMASLAFLRDADLHQVALFKPGGSNGLTAYAARGLLWVTDLLGGYYCPSPQCLQDDWSKPGELRADGLGRYPFGGANHRAGPGDRHCDWTRGTTAADPFVRGSRASTP
jgi:hypothetical protein